MPRRDLPEQLVGSVAQPGSQQRTHYNITDEVHSKNHTRNSDAHGQDEQASLQLWIENAQGYRDGERAHGVARGEGKLVRGKDVRPAVRFEVARALAVAGLFHATEKHNGGNFR